MRGSWVLVLLLAESVARADEHPPDVPITYHSDPSCPDEAAFHAALAKRTSSHRRPEAAHVRSFDIDLVANPRGFAGKLRTHDEGDHVTEREVAAPTCGEVVDAVAFFCAVSLGFDALVEEEPAPPPPPPPPPALPPPPPVLEAPRPVRRPMKAASPVRLTTGVDVAAMANVVGASARPSIGAFVSIGRRTRSWFDPEARLGLTTALSDTFQSASGTASLTLVAARLDLCPLGARAWRFELRPCAAVFAGALLGQGSGVGNARGAALPWVAFAPLLFRLEWNVAGPVALEAEGGVTVATATHRFYFVPDETLYTTPLVGEWVGGGLKVFF